VAIGWLHAGEWLSGVVDGAMGGKYSSLKLDGSGNAHVAYYDEVQGSIGYSFWDHQLNKWFNTSLDRGSGFCSLVLDSKQRPHISFTEGSGRLKHVYWDGSSWQRQVIDVHAKVINYYTSITLDAKDNPSISFYEEFGAGDNRLRLRIVTWNGAFWEVRTADPDLGSGKFNSMVTNAAGNLEIAYGVVEYQNASLRYARWNGRSWDVEILEGKGQPGTSMWSVAMVLDKNGAPHVTYTDVVNGVLKYATRKDGKWRFIAVDSLSRVAYPDRNGIALDSQGRPHISYFDAGAGVLKVAHQEGEQWVIETVDRGGAGFTSSLEIDKGWLWLTYANAEGTGLKVLRTRLENHGQKTRAVPDGEVKHR
jgi:hypothetical protein